MPPEIFKAPYDAASECVIFHFGFSPRVIRALRLHRLSGIRDRSRYPAADLVIGTRYPYAVVHHSLHFPRTSLHDER